MAYVRSDLNAYPIPAPGQGCSQQTMVHRAPSYLALNAFRYGGFSEKPLILILYETDVDKERFLKKPQNYGKKVVLNEYYVKCTYYNEEVSKCNDCSESWVAIMEQK